MTTTTSTTPVDSRPPSSSPTPEDEDDLTSTVKELRATKEESWVLEKKVTKQEVLATQETKKQHSDRLKTLRATQNAQLNVDKKASGEARLLFLQQQVEVFSHFTGQTAETVEAENAKKKAKKKEGRTRMTEEEEDKELLAAGAQAARATRLTVQPGCIKGGDMRPYQIEGLNWMVNLYNQGLNGILADEMGLGKTLQSISLLGYLKFERGVSGPHIVVVPKAVITNWMREFKKWCPDMRVVNVHGDKDERARQIAETLIPGTFDVCMTTFEVLMIEKSAFLKFQWRYLIVDEAHRLKSEASKTSQVIRELDTQFRLLVTGTPLQNNLHELWALLNFLLPEVFGDSEVFEEYFKLEDMKEESVVSRLHAILRPFMLRRLKVDVEKSLPPKREIKLYTGMSEMQEYWYKTVLNRDIALLNQLGGPDRSRLLNILMQLRKVCNHPYLFQGAEPGPPYQDGPHLWENAGKMALLDKLLMKLKANGDRVLIFSQMTRLLDILEDYMRAKQYEYCRIDGSTKGEDRDAEMDAFNKPDSTKFVFLLSTRAGGLGINLATANIVVLYDSDWNPQMDLQAQDRAHRIGQKKEVTVFRMVTEGTIEEKIIERAEKKLYLDAVVVQQGRLQQQNAALSKNELMTMVKFGAESIFRAGGKKISDEDIDAILERDSKRTDESRKKFQTDVQHNLLNFKLESAADESQILMAPADAEAAALGVSNFINLPARTNRPGVRAVEDDVSREPQKPRGIAMSDFQFYDQARIRQIEEIDHDLAQRRKNQQSLIKEARAREKRDRVTAMLEDDDNATTDASGQVLESVKLQREMDESMMFPEEFRLEKARLMSEAFHSWLRKDFRVYVGAVERVGRDNLDEIVKIVQEQTTPQKTKADIQNYHNTFWQRLKELEGWERLKERIEKGEQRIRRREEIKLILQRKLAKHTNPWQTLQIEYGSARGKTFNEDEDRFLVCTTHRLGYGNWEQIRMEIRKNWQFRFNWYFKSRTAEDLRKRVDVLIKMIEKELEDDGGVAGSKKRKAEEDEVLPSNSKRAKE